MKWKERLNTALFTFMLKKFKKKEFLLYSFCTFGTKYKFANMEASNQTLSQINEVLNDLVTKYPPQAEEMVLTDISIQVRQDCGELTLFNDDDEEIASVVVDDWIDSKDEDFQEDVEGILRSCLEKRKQEMDNLSLLRPYSFVLVDENKETISDLYLVDDNTLIFDSDTLMKGLEEDLDNFIDRLMKE